jgi:alpha-tubulin suppressor-like RCC1 family protein
VEVSSESTFSVLGAGLSHTCALDGSGAPYCWGRNLNGQLGNGSRTDRSRATPASGGLSFETLVSGWNHSCGLTSNGRAYCWGLNGDGQIGDGTRVDRLVPTPISGTFQDLDAGAAHTCGISRASVLCWGDNGFGQVGEGADAAGQTVPVPVTGLPSSPTSLALGAVHSCALLDDGSAYCWGQNLHGQLGNGTTDNSSTPRQVAGDLLFVRLYAGGGMTCGFQDDGSQYCWGMNQGGQLGDGSRTNRTTPIRVSGR